MISFMDRAFCASDVEEHTCGRELTPELQKKAKRWWGFGKGEPPIAYGKFCEEVKENKTNG